MKLPRWLLWSMQTLSVAFVLAGAGWWWVTWPERTATLFVAFLASDQLGSAELHIEPPPPGQVEPPEGGRITFGHSYVEWQVGYNKVPILDFARVLIPELRLEEFGESHAIMSPRSVSDLVLARQCFKIVPGGGGTLIAQRGRVLQQW